MFSRTNVGLLTERGLPPSPRTRPRTNCVLPAPSSPFRATHSPPRNVVASSAAMASVCSTLVEVRFTRESLYRVRTSGKEEGEPQRHRGHRENTEKDKLIRSAFALLSALCVSVVPSECFRAVYGVALSFERTCMMPSTLARSSVQRSSSRGGG